MANRKLYPSDPWPLPGHPEAMKMGLPPRLYSHQCVEGKFCELRHHGVLGSSAQPRSNTYERPWLRSASCGYFRDFPDFLILPSGVEPYCMVAPGRFKACMAFLERETCAF